MKPGQGFDGLLIDRTGMYIVEIKNLEGVCHFTDCELALKYEIESLGGTYWAIMNLKQAAELIGLSID